MQLNYQSRFKVLRLILCLVTVHSTLKPSEAAATLHQVLPEYYYVLFSLQYFILYSRLQ
jgi:hypothetical protein